MYSPALSLLWFHGSVKREMNGMQALFCLMIKKVNAESRKFNIEYPVFSFRSLRNLIIVHKLCCLFLWVTLRIPLPKLCFDPLWIPDMTHLF